LLNMQTLKIGSALVGILYISLMTGSGSVGLENRAVLSLLRKLEQLPYRATSLYRVNKLMVILIQLDPLMASRYFKIGMDRLYLDIESRLILRRNAVQLIQTSRLSYNQKRALIISIDRLIVNSPY